MKPVKFRTIFRWIQAKTTNQEWLNIPMQQQGHSFNVKTFANVILCKNATSGTEYVLDKAKYDRAYERMNKLPEPQRWQNKNYVRPAWKVSENHCAPTAMILCKFYCEQNQIQN